jgi:hypothetical protein
LLSIIHPTGKASPEGIKRGPVLDGLSRSRRRNPASTICLEFAKIENMPTSTDLRPLTNEQAVQLRHDLTLVEERLQDIAILMRVCYGEDSQAVIRADETTAALQRLKWELERTKLRTQAAGSA